MIGASPKSILFVGAFPRPAALERFVSGDLAGRLQERGWKAQLTSRQPRRLARLGSIILETWLGGTRCDLACVDVFSGPAFLWAQAACATLRQRRKPYVLILHGGNLPDFAKRHPARVTKLLNSAAAVTCPSAYLTHEMRPFCPDLVLIPNGIDLSRYPFRERRPPFQLLVWVRAFHEIYNPRMAVTVLQNLRARSIECELTMIGLDKGDGSLQKTKVLAAQYGLNEFVHFRGAVPKRDVPSELGRGDIFLNTTNFDNTPVSVIEAMACGLPVISTNAGGLPYLLEQGKTALLVNPGAAGDMAAAIRRLVAEPKLAAGLSERARRSVESFDWEIVLPQWERLLEGVIQKEKTESGKKAGLVARSGAACEKSREQK